MVTSSHLDDLLAIAEVWHQLPSDLAVRYMPELRTRYHVTPADLFMLDVAATARWAALKRQQSSSSSSSAATQQAQQMGPHARPGSAVSAVSEHGDHLAIRGNEIPPWDPRYKGKR